MRQDNMRRLWPYLIIGGTALLLYCRVLGLGTINYDDNIHIFENPLLNPPSLDGLVRFWQAPFMGLYIPVTYSVWTLLSGLAHAASGPGRAETMNLLCHATNWFLHAINGLVLYRILRHRMGFASIQALIGALGCICHPLQVEAVAWISSLRDLLAGFGALVTLDAMLACYRQPPVAAGAKLWRYGFISASYLLAMLAKPAAIVTPLMGVLLGWAIELTN